MLTDLLVFHHLQRQIPGFVRVQGYDFGFLPIRLRGVAAVE